MAKNKPSAPLLAGWSAVDVVLARLNRVEADRLKILARMSEKIEAVRSDYQPTLDALGMEDDGLRVQVQDYCEANRSDLGPGKSRDLRHGLVKFYFGSKGLQLLRKWTWKKVLQAARDSLAEWAVERKPSIAKEAILRKHAAGDVDDAELALIGVKVGQDEFFSIELHTEKDVSHE